MPEITRQLRITFSKDEIKEILAERAKALVLKRKEVPCVELTQVEDLQGEATVVLIVGNKPIDTTDRDKLINARDALLAEVESLEDQLDGRIPMMPVPQLKKAKRRS